MTNGDFIEFSKIWTASWELAGRKVSPTQIDMSFQVLRRFDISDIKRALTSHFNDPDAGQYPPKPADVVRHIDGGKKTRSALAWSKVERSIRSVGGMQSVVFDDPIIHIVITDMGGWLKMTRITEKELPFVGKEFETRYQGYALRGGVSEWPCKLIGEAEWHNAKDGYKVPLPVLVGEPGRAKKVLENGSNDHGLLITRADDVVKTALKRVGVERRVSRSEQCAQCTPRKIL